MAGAPAAAARKPLPERLREKLREQNEANKAVVGRLEAKIQELQVDLKAKNKLIDKMTEAAANDFSQNQALSAAVQHHKSLA